MDEEVAVITIYMNARGEKRMDVAAGVNPVMMFLDALAAIERGRMQASPKSKIVRPASGIARVGK